MTIHAHAHIFMRDSDSDRQENKMEEGETSVQQQEQDEQEQDGQEQDEQEGQEGQEGQQEQQQQERQQQQWWWQQQLLPARSNLRRNERRSLGDGAAGCDRDGVERDKERIPVKRKLTDLNEHLLCVLCSGYMIDPTAAIECLHTFCRKCILRFMESSTSCPRCDVPFHLTNPLLGIRSDRTLQTIIYKLVPGLYEEEIKRRCTAANMAISEGKDSGTVERIMENVRDATKGITIYTGEEKFSLSIRLDGSEPPIDLTKSKRHSVDLTKSKPHSVYLTRKKRLALKSPKIDRVYLLCPSAFTIGHLKKLLYLKFTIDLDFPIDILHGNDRLRDEYSLVDVAYITSWQNVTPMELTCQVLPKYSTMTSRKASTEKCAKNRFDTANVKQRNLGKQTTGDHAMRIFKSKKTKPIECSSGSGEESRKGPEDWSKIISDKREQPTETKNKETCRNFVKTNTKSPEKVSEVHETKADEKSTFKSKLQQELYAKKSEAHEKKTVEKLANVAEKYIESSKKQSSDKSSASSISKKVEVTSLKKPEVKIVTQKKAELMSVHSKMDVTINRKKSEVTQLKKPVVTLTAQKKSEMTSKKPEMTIKQQETKIPCLSAIRKRKFVYTDDKEDDDDDEDRFVFEKIQKKKVDSKEELRNLSHATVLINEILSEQSKCSSAPPPPPPGLTGHPADSALSPGQSSTVSESPTDDRVDSLSANLAKNQRSGTSSVSMTSSSATERNVFEKFSSIMGSANENVVSSSTSSQVSEEDDDAVGSGDVTGSKTSVETQTSDITPPPPAIREMKAASSGKIQKSTASSGGSITEARGDKDQAKKTSCSVSLADVGNTGQFQKPTSGGLDPGVMSSTPRSANASAVASAAGSTHRSPILTADIKPTRDLQRHTASVQLLPLSSPAAASSATSLATSSADAPAAAAAARGSSLKKTAVISPKQKTIAVASNNIPSLGPEIARSSYKACKDTSPARSAPANASATLVKTTSTAGARPTSVAGVGSACGSSLGTAGGSVQRLQEATRDNYISRPAAVDDPSRIARNAAAAAVGRTSGLAAAPGKRSEACISLSRTAVAGAICSPILLPSAAIPSAEERADNSIVGHIRPAEVATTDARRRAPGSFWNSAKEIASCAPTKNIETDKLSPEHNNNPQTSQLRESDDLPFRHMAAGAVVKSGSATGRSGQATTSKSDDKSPSNPPSKARLFKPYQMDSRPKSPAQKSVFPTSGLSSPFPSHSELSRPFRTSDGINFPYASTSSSRNPEVETRAKVNSQEAINLSHSPSEPAEREETNNNVKPKSAVHGGFPCLIKVPNFKPSDRNVSSARSTERTGSHRKEMKGGLEEKTSPVASISLTTASIPHPSSVPSSSFPSASAPSFASSSTAIHRLPVLKISPYRRSSLDRDRAPLASSSSLQAQDQTRDPQPNKADRVRNLMQYSISTVSKSPSPVRAHASATCASPGIISCKDAEKTDIPSKPSSSLSLENRIHTKATSRAHEGSISSASGRGKQASPVLVRSAECTKTASEVFYTCSEADSGSSPSKRATGSRSSSTSSMGSRTDSSSRLDESSDFGLTKKLVIDLDRLSPPPSFQTSPEKSPSRCIPADKASPIRDSPTSPGKKRLVFSIRKTEEQYRCTRSRSFPETNNSSTSPTFSSSTSLTYSSSSTAESLDAAEGLLPPSAKRIKFLGKDFTFTRTLDTSKCSRPPRRRRSTATCGGSQQASPTSDSLHPVVVTKPELLPCGEPVAEVSNPVLPPPAILRMDEDLPTTPSSTYEVDSTSGGMVSSLPCVEGTSSDVPEAAEWNINSQLSIPYQPDAELDAPLELTKKVKSSVDDVPLELLNKDVPLELTTKEVKDRQKQLEYQKLMSTYPPSSKLFACVLPAS